MSEQNFQPTGMHHVSALSAHIQRSHDFYTQVLGMRPLLKTVNQDDPRMYHLFYGDGAASVGSDLTFFDLPKAARERHGNNSIIRSGLRIASDNSFDYWQDRLDSFGVQRTIVHERNGHRVIDFEDREGTQLSLIDDGGQEAAFPWDASPVPVEHQIRGLAYVNIMVPILAPTDRFLREVLGLERRDSYPAQGAPKFQTYVYTMGEGKLQQQLHVTVRDDLPAAKYGAGGVHHLALRVQANQSIQAWAERISQFGYRHSGVIDRHYFRSIYVREPNGVLIELATDEPGFFVDGPVDANRLTLPPALEDRRSEIEANLQPLI